MKNKIVSLLIFLSIFVSIFNLTKSEETINLIGELQIPNTSSLDIWGYTDENTGIRYALLGATNALSIIDLSDKTNPKLVAKIDSVEAFDIKTWKNYVYIVTGAHDIGNIFDISDPNNPVAVGTFPDAHNITISEKGFLYASIPGIIIYDLNETPTNPELVYSEDICNKRGHDINIIGDRLFHFTGYCGVSIYDVSRPDTLELLGKIPQSGIYIHSGWTSEDGNYLYVNDELAEKNMEDIKVWDISDIENPIEVDSFKDTNARVHNIYIEGNYAFVSFYRAGFRVFDIEDPLDMQLVAEYDTDTTSSGPEFGGNFGLYTFWGSDEIIASDIRNGLLVFEVQGLLLGVEEEEEDNNDILIFPNPTADNTNLTYSINSRNDVQISLYNFQGQLLKNIYSGIKDIGTYKLNVPTINLSQGIYYIKVEIGESYSIRKLKILK